MFFISAVLAESAKRERERERAREKKIFPILLLHNIYTWKWLYFYKEKSVYIVC